MKINFKGPIDKKIQDEIYFLVKYCTDLTEEGISKEEIIYLLSHVCACVLEGMLFSEDVLNIFVDQICKNYKLIVKHRQEVGDYNKDHI